VLGRTPHDRLAVPPPFPRYEASAAWLSPRCAERNLRPFFHDVDGSLTQSVNWVLCATRSSTLAVLGTDPRQSGCRSSTSCPSGDPSPFPRSGLPTCAWSGPRSYATTVLFPTDWEQAAPLHPASSDSGPPRTRKEPESHLAGRPLRPLFHGARDVCRRFRCRSPYQPATYPHLSTAPPSFSSQTTVRYPTESPLLLPRSSVLLTEETRPLSHGTDSLGQSITLSSRPFQRLIELLVFPSINSVKI
jgi:hypothetical protein